jgi:hypothetical protein
VGEVRLIIRNIHLLVLVPGLLFAQQGGGAGTQGSGSAATVPSSAAPGGQATIPGEAGSTEDKRAFGVLPNYRTAESDQPFVPITTKQKFKIAAKDTFDWPSYILGGAFAGISQLDNSNPSFGQGLEGYAKRYAANVADQDLGNFMTEAIMPTLLHEDPRYFRKGSGPVGRRILYATTRVLITKTDSGTSSFNFAEFLGNGSVAALGNAYYPDAKGFSPTIQRMFTQIGTDAISQVLKEFWPDVKRKYFTKHANNTVGD